METWEAIKYLTEHPEAKFNNKDGYILRTNGHLLVFENEKYRTTGIDCNIRITAYDNDCKPDEWELVKQPVPFMEAVKAYSEGKKVTAKYKSFNSREEIKMSFWKDVDGSQDNDPHDLNLSFYVIEEAVWFIE